MSYLVRCDQGVWIKTTISVRPPCNSYFKCWAYHSSGKVVVAAGSDPGWTNGSLLYWMPCSLRHTAFCDWEWRDEDRPANPYTAQITIEKQVIT
jgi:hypothetical protein